MATRTLLLGLVVALAPSLALTGADGAAPEHSQQTSNQQTNAMKIRIRVDGKVITATLIDNETARDFVSLLPLTLTMDDLFGREKFGRLPRAISDAGPRTDAYEVGEVV